MAIIPRIPTIFTADPIKNVLPDTRKMSLSVFLAMGLSIFAVVCEICQNNHSFRRCTCHKFITSWLKADISATLFTLATPSYRPPPRLISVVTTGLLLPTQSPAAPLNRHHRRQAFRTACQLIGELLLALCLSSFAQPNTHVLAIATPIQNTGCTPSER